MREHFFDGKRLDRQRLYDIGFRDDSLGLFRETTFLNGQFLLQIAVRNDGVDTCLIDEASGEEYVLHHVKEAVGSFVGSVRTEYDAVLSELEACLASQDVFSLPYTLKLIEYVRDKYGDEPEYLWKNFPKNAIWRRKDTKKWYGVLLTVKESSLDKTSNDDRETEVLNVRHDPTATFPASDGKTILPGYHMNKAHWISVRLDGSVPFEKICALLSYSYSYEK